MDNYNKHAQTGPGIAFFMQELCKPTGFNNECIETKGEMDELLLGHILLKSMINYCRARDSSQEETKMIRSIEFQEAQITVQVPLKTISIFISNIVMERAKIKQILLRKLVKKNNLPNKWY